MSLHCVIVVLLGITNVEEFSLLVEGQKEEKEEVEKTGTLKRVCIHEQVMRYFWTSTAVVTNNLLGRVQTKRITYWNRWTANSEKCTTSYCGTRHYELTLGHMALFVKSKGWTQMVFPFLSHCWVHCLCIRVMQLKELSLIGFLGTFYSFQLTDNAIFWHLLVDKAMWPKLSTFGIKISSTVILIFELWSICFDTV